MLMRAIRGTRDVGNRIGMDEPPTKRQHVYRDEGVLDPEMQFIGKKLQLALLLNQNGECLLDKIPDNYKTVYEEDFPYGHDLEEFVPSLKEYFKCSKESDGNWHVKAKHVPIDETKIILEIIVKAYMGNWEQSSTSHSDNGDATFRNSNPQNPFESPVSICDGNLAGSIPSDLTSILDDIEGLRALLNCTENDHIEELGSNLNDVQTQVIDLVPVAPNCNVEVTQRCYNNSVAINDERMDENEWNNNGSSTSEAIGNNPSVVYPIMSSNETTTCVSQYPSMDRSRDPITRLSENVDSSCCRYTEETSLSCSCTEPGYCDHSTHNSERSKCMNAYSCSTLNSESSTNETENNLMDVSDSPSGTPELVDNPIANSQLSRIIDEVLDSSNLITCDESVFDEVEAQVSSPGGISPAISSLSSSSYYSPEPLPHSSSASISLEDFSQEHELPEILKKNAAYLKPKKKKRGGLTIDDPIKYVDNWTCVISTGAARRFVFICPKNGNTTFKWCPDRKNWISVPNLYLPPETVIYAEIISKRGILNVIDVFLIHGENLSGWEFSERNAKWKQCFSQWGKSIGMYSIICVKHLQVSKLPGVLKKLQKSEKYYSTTPNEELFTTSSKHEIKFKVQEILFLKIVQGTGNQIVEFRTLMKKLVCWRWQPSLDLKKVANHLLNREMEAIELNEYLRHNGV